MEMDDDSLIVELMDIEDKEHLAQEEEWQQLQAGLWPEERTEGSVAEVPDHDDGSARRVSPLNTILWIIIGIGIAAAVFRLL